MIAEAIVNSFEAVGLQTISKVAALFRFDTKFLLPANRLELLLENMQQNFTVLEIERKRIHFYETLYFDTKGFKLYLDHHNGKLNRMKVRVRKYATTNEVFFEVKHKLRGYQTGKLRIPRQKMMFELEANEWQAIHERDKHIHGLEKKLITTFNRITLNNKSAEERITIDTEICFNNFVQQKCLPEVVVIEVKHTQPHVTEAVREMLKEFGAQETSFSKYAIGIALLEKNIKANLFKPALLQLKKIANGLN